MKHLTQFDTKFKLDKAIEIMIKEVYRNEIRSENRNAKSQAVEVWDHSARRIDQAGE